MKNNKVLKSIAGSTFFKLASAVVSFVSVPLLLKTLGTNNYAVWVTMTALVGWLNLFDFGSGYSLKNKITESQALNDFENLEPLIAGTIQFYLLMTLTIMICFIGSLFFIKVFNTHIVLSFIIYLPIILSFPSTLGHFMIQGLKKFNAFNLILLSQSVVWLIVVFFFRQGFFTVSIYKLAACYSMLFALANGTILTISLRNMHFNWSAIFNIDNFKSSKDSLLVGTKFFFLQISSLFIFSLGNIMTYNHLNLLNVAQYDTVNKVFLMGMTIFNVAISVYWAEISHAKALNDKGKLLKLYKQLLLLSFGFSLGCLVVTFLMPVGISYWTKNMIHIQLNQLYPFLILVTFQAFAYSGAVFLNAFEQLKGQIVMSLIGAVLIIPLANFIFKMNFGIGTMPLAAALLTAPSVVYVLTKSYKTINSLK